MIGHDDIKLVSNELLYNPKTQKPEHFTYKLQLRESDDEEFTPIYKAVKIMRLKRLPKSQVENSSFMDIMDDVVGAMARREQSMISIIANIIHPKPLGLLFCYGVQALGRNLNQAVDACDKAYSALEATLRGSFPQIDLRTLEFAEMEWLQEKLYREMSKVEMIRGLPKRRLSATHSGNKSSSPMGEKKKGGDKGEEEQNEEFIRGLIAMEKEFVLLTVATPIKFDDLNLWLDNAAEEESLWASEVQGQKSVSFGIAMPMMFMSNLGAALGTSSGTATGTSHQHGTSHSEGTSQGTTVGHTEGTTVTHGTSSSVANGVSESRSHSEGFNTGRSVSDSVSHGTSQNWGTSQSQGTSESTSHGTSSSHSTGTSQSESTSHSTGTSHSEGTSHSTSSGTSDSQSHGTSQSHNEGGSTSDGWDKGNNQGGSTAQQQSVQNSKANAEGVTRQEQLGFNVGVKGEPSAFGFKLGSVSGGISGTGSRGASANTTNTTGVTKGTTNTENWSASQGQSHSDGKTWGDTTGTSETTSHGTSSSVSDGRSVTDGTSVTDSISKSTGTSTSDSQGVSDSVSKGVSTSQGTSTGQGVSEGTSHGVTVSEGRSVSDGVSTGTSRTVSDGVSDSVGRSTSESVSKSSGRSTSDGVSESEGSNFTRNVGSSTTQSTGTSSSLAVGPSISFSKSVQWKNVNKEVLAKISQLQTQRMYNAVQAGAFYVDSYMLAEDDETLQAAAALVHAAFWGEETVCPIQVVRPDEETQEHLRLHALTFTGCTMREQIPDIVDGFLWSTVMLPAELTALVHPPRLEAGGLRTVTEDIPFLPLPRIESIGEIELGMAMNPETGLVSKIPFTIRKEALMHCLIAGASGSGKSISAQNAISEITTKLKIPALILDWKTADWSRLYNLVPPERFRFYGLDPYAAVPIEMNVFVPPKYVHPMVWRDKVIESLAVAMGYGPKQFGLLIRHTNELFFHNDVIEYFNPLEFDGQGQPVKIEKNRCFEHWGDWDKPSLPDEGVPELHPRWAQNIRKVTLAMLYSYLALCRKNLDRNSRALSDTYDSLLTRLENYVSGDLRKCYCSTSPNIVTPSDLLEGEKVVVLEGGLLPPSDKKFIINMLANGVWLHVKEKMRKEHKPTPLLIVFEEAHEVMPNNDMGDQPLQLPQSCFEEMWNEGRSFGLTGMAICQMPSHMPLSVCVNSSVIVAHRLGEEKDIELMMRLIGRESKFDGRDVARFMSRLPIGMAICRSARSFNLLDGEPSIVAMNFLELPVPTDDELRSHAILYQRKDASAAERKAS